MQESRISSALVVGASFVIAAVAFGLLYYAAQSSTKSDALSVTGSAKERVTSDQAKLVIAISRIAPMSGLASGYASVARDAGLLQNLLDGAGVAGSAVTMSPVSMNQMYEQYTGGETRYQLNQTVSVQSGDVAKVTELSKRVPGLAEKGAVASVQSLEYYYSKLPDLRVSLLTEAVKDAKDRAAKIAEGTGRRVGDVVTASAGVVQVLTPNSVDVSDYGSYDTSGIEKDVMVTVKASFRLR